MSPSGIPEDWLQRYLPPSCDIEEVGVYVSMKRVHSRAYRDERGRLEAGGCGNEMSKR